MSALAAQPDDLVSSLRRRLAAACLAAAIVVGSLVLWIGVPVAGFWVGGQVTTTAEGYLLFVLAAVPLSMVLMGWALYRLNSLYEGLRRGDPAAGSRSAWLTSLSEERAQLRRRRGRPALIDVAMATSAVLALVLMVVWFFFLAEMRLVNPL